MNSVDVVVIGAGLTGLSTAHFLKKAGKTVLVVESNKRVGGSIDSFTQNGFVYEHGPNTGVLSNIETVELFDDLAGLCELEIANPEAKKRLILKDNMWHALPSNLKTAVKTPLFSLKDKFRILGEPFRAKGTDEHENLEDFVLRRLGKSFYEYAVDPFVSGVYAGDPKKLIPKYALPKLYNLEQDYGSFIRGTIKKAKLPKTDSEKRVTKDVFSTKGGLKNLINALTQSVGEENIILHADDYSVRRKDGKYFVEIINNVYVTSNVVSTIPPDYIHTHFPFLEKTKLEVICDFAYSPVVEIAVGFKEWTGMDINAFGGLIPSKEDKDLLGVLFMSSLLSERAPEGGALFSVFMGGIKKKRMHEFSDAVFFEMVRDSFIEFMGLYQFKPDLFVIQRHLKAIPQYDIRSKARFETIHKLENEFPRLYLRGNMIDGIGMADRIKQAKHISTLIQK